MNQSKDVRNIQKKFKMLYNCDMHNFYAVRDHVKFVLQSYRLWYGNRPLLLHKQPFL